MVFVERTLPCPKQVIKMWTNLKIKLPDFSLTLEEIKNFPDLIQKFPDFSLTVGTLIRADQYWN